MVKVILKKKQEPDPLSPAKPDDINASSLGKTLRDARKNKNLTIERLSELTKIPLWHLEALELGNYDRLPPDVYIKGVFKRLTKFLDVSPDEFNAKYEEDRSFPVIAHTISTKESKNPDLSLKDLRTFDRDFWALTPKKITAFAGILFFLLIFAYLWYQYDNFTGPPSLVLANPAQDLEVLLPDLEVRGRTSGDAYLTINGQNVYVSPDGAFSSTVRLSAGINALEIIVRNRLGKENKMIRRVLYNTDQNQ